MNSSKKKTKTSGNTLSAKVSRLNFEELENTWAPLYKIEMDALDDDETNIEGETNFNIGKKLKKISSKMIKLEESEAVSEFNLAIDLLNTNKEPADLDRLKRRLGISREGFGTLEPSKEQLSQALSKLNEKGAQKLIVILLSNLSDGPIHGGSVDVKSVFCSLLRNNVWDFSKEKIFYAKDEVKDFYEAQSSKNSENNKKETKRSKHRGKKTSNIDSLVDLYMAELDVKGYAKELYDIKEHLFAIANSDGTVRYLYDDYNNNPYLNVEAYDYKELLSNIKSYGWSDMLNKDGSKKFSNSCYSNCLVPKELTLDFLNLNGLSNILTFNQGRVISQNEIAKFVSKWAEIVISNCFTKIDIESFEKQLEKWKQIAQKKFKEPSDFQGNFAVPKDVFLNENESNIEKWLSEHSDNYFLLKCLGWKTPACEWTKIVSNALEVASSSAAGVENIRDNSDTVLHIRSSGLLKMINFVNQIGLDPQILPEKGVLLEHLLKIEYKKEEQELLLSTLSGLFKSKLINGNVTPLYEKNPFRVLLLNYGDVFDLEKCFKWFLNHGWHLNEEKNNTQTIGKGVSGKLKGLSTQENTNKKNETLSGKILLDLLADLPTCLYKEEKWGNYSKVIEILMKEQPDCININLDGKGVLAKLNGAIVKCDRGMDSQESLIFTKMLDLFDLFLEKGVPLESLVKNVKPLDVIENELLEKRVKAFQEKNEILRRLEEERAKSALDILEKIKSGGFVVIDKDGESVDLATVLGVIEQKSKDSLSIDKSSSNGNGLKIRRL